MINLYTTITKLQQFQHATSGRGLTFPSMMEEVACFLRDDLDAIIADLHQQQLDADKQEAEYQEQEAEYQREITALEKQQELTHELNRDIEERVSA